MTKVPVSAVVLTFNEELNLEKCLESVAGWASDVVVVDSFSTDGTLEIARRFTDRVLQHRYEGHPQQWKWALACVPFANEWILALDADFVVTRALADLIRDAVSTAEPDVDGFFVRHRQVFRGRPLRFGSTYPRYWLRLFRKDRVRLDEHDLVDLHFYVDGKTARLDADVLEDNRKEREFGFWVRKQVKFAERQALEETQRLETPAGTSVRGELFSSPDRRILWLKERWIHLPLFARSVAYFLYRYFLRLGFLDGKEGFLYHVSQALLYRVMVDARLEEHRRGWVSSGQGEER